MRSTAMAVAASLSLGLAPAAQTAVARIEPFDLRVVDRRTGEPVPGALVFFVDERTQGPPRGEFYSSHHARADEHGLVRAGRALGDWTYVEAPRYATTAWFAVAEDRILDVLPGIDVPVRLLDWAGRPAAGGRIGLCLGCGHTPDVQVAVAGSDGVAWFRNVELTHPEVYLGDRVDIHELYPLASGLDGDNRPLVWRPGDPPFVLRCAGAVDLAGRVIDHDGQPVEDALIDQGTEHRGATTRTDEQGRFTMPSPMAGKRGLAVWVRERPLTDAFMPPTVPVTLRLPAEHGRTPATVPVEVRVVSAGDGTPIENVTVFGLPEVADLGSGDQAATDATGVASLELPPGPAVLWTEATAIAPMIETKFVVPGTATATTLAIAGQPLHLAVNGITPEKWTEIALATEYGDLTLEIVDGACDLVVPADTASAIHIRHAGHQRTYPIDASTRAAGRLTVSWPRPLIVTGTVVGTRSGSVAFDESDPTWHDISSGRFEFATDQEGGALLRVRANGGLEHIVHVTLPEFGTATACDLGDIPANPVSLRIFDESGTAAAGSRVYLLRPGLCREAELQDDGYWRDLQPRAGDHVVVEWSPPHHVEGEDGLGRANLHRQLTGDGPWTLRENESAVTFRFVDGSGAPLTGVEIFHRERRWHITADTFTVSGLESGRHPFVLRHDTAGTGILEVEVPDQADLEIRAQFGN